MDHRYLVYERVDLRRWCL